MIVALFFIFLVLFLISYYLTKRIFSPSSILTAAFSFSIFCALINYNRWGLSDFSSETFTLILVGTLSFIIPSLFIEYFYRRHKNRQYLKYNNTKSLSFLKLNTSVILVVTFISVLIVAMNFYFIVKMVGGGFTSLSNIMNLYRNQSLIDGSGERAVPTVWNQIFKLNTIFGYVFLYLFFNNFFYLLENKCLLRKSFIYLIPCITFAFGSLLSGGRFELINFCIAGVVMSYIFYISIHKRKLSIKTKFKFLFLIVFVFLLILILFSASRTLVGRTNDENIIEYISTYFGGSIKLLDMYAREPKMVGLQGQSTFFGIFKLLSQFGFISNFNESLRSEFRVYNGIELGNVYTIFRGMFQDFGYFGMIVLMFIFGSIMTIFYNKILRKQFFGKIKLSVIFYCMISYTIFLAPFSQYFYGNILSFNYFVYLILYLVVIYIFNTYFVRRVYYLKNRNVKIRKIVKYEKGA